MIVLKLGFLRDFSIIVQASKLCTFVVEPNSTKVEAKIIEFIKAVIVGK